jgi:hypothetical protein
VNHESLSQYVQRHANKEQPTEVACPADQVADDEEEDPRDDLESAADVAGFCDAEVANNLEEGGKVTVPAVIGHLVGCIEEACTENSTVCKEFVLEERLRGPVNLVEAKEDHGNEAGDDHGDDVVGFPAVGGGGCEGEGEEKDGQTAGEEDDSGN